MSAHDRYLAGYRSDSLRVTCSHCGVSASITAETEYGATWWLPEECPHCGEPWSEDAVSGPDGPDEDRAYDRWCDDREIMGT